jgi:hypothetical protein
VFASRYLAQLDRCADDITTKLGWLTDEFGPVCLLCFERRVRGAAGCHRRRFAQWWEARTGEVIAEYDGR